ncbi:MAG: ATP-binding protein [Vicinamibacterales bacterium]
MGNSLAEQSEAITISSPEPLPAPGDHAVPTSKPSGAARRSRKPVRGGPAGPLQAAPPAVSSGPITPEDFYRDLVWNLRNGVIAVTDDGGVAVMNHVAYRILGLKPRTTDIGRPYTAVLKDQPDMIRMISGAFELSHLPNRAEMRLKPTGKVIGYTLSQVRDASGKVRGATLFFKDLTRVEQLEERERLRDRLAALGEMAAAIAHEVKNPLAGIEVMAGLLKRQLSDSPDAQTILGDIIKEAKMANAIVLEVLEFVRPIRLQVEYVSLGSAIVDAVSHSEGLARGKVEVDLQIAPDLPPIQGDQYQLRQIFTNLLINAYEAMNGRGAVRIVATTLPEEEAPGTSETVNGPTVQVEVIDNGPGIPPETVDRIFSPFFTTKPQGSGLGLAIVRKIVDAHDGRIDVSVGPYGGTTFRVTLPVNGSHELFKR